MTVRVRFAPSPTGKLHVGNVRTALVNKLVALASDGQFVVRMEDTDVSREVEGSESVMLEQLDWLGLTRDEDPLKGGDYGPYRTNERAARGDYKKAVETLMAAGRAYECFVSKTELDLMRKIQSSQGLPPHYDNRHRDLTAEQIEAFKAEGLEPVIRFKLNDAEIVFEDLVRGTVRYEAKHLGGDPVIVRADGTPLFTLGGVVDDINQKMTHVIRGEDHVTNTAVQIQIFEALGATPPVMAHMPMLLDTDGGKLSKRLDSLSIEQLQADGYHPHAIVVYLASLGFGHGADPLPLADIANNFDFSKMGRSAVRFDLEQLDRVNAHVLHDMSWEEAQPFVRGFLPEGAEEHEKIEFFWQAFRENITTFKEAGEHFALCYGDMPAVNMDDEDVAYLKQAEETLPAGPYDADTWQTWVGVLKESTGRKGKPLFMPLRLALTGQPHGPEMGNLLPVLGERMARERLRHVIGS